MKVIAVLIGLLVLASLVGTGLAITEPTEKKGGLMDRSEMMVSGDYGLVNVPVGHEDLIKSYDKAFASLPNTLRLLQSQVYVWFESSGSGGILTSQRRDAFTGGSLNGYDMTVEGINGVPQAVTEGDLAYALAGIVFEPDTPIPFSVDSYNRAVENDFAANPTAPKYVTPGSADWASENFGEREVQNSIDFQESVRMWVTDHDGFAKKYPNRSKMLDQIFDYQSPPVSSGNASLDNIKSESSEPLPNTVYNQAAAYIISKYPEVKWPPASKVFDNNTNYLELTDGGPGGTGVVPGSILNILLTNKIDRKVAEELGLAKNFTATTKPIDKGPTVYLLHQMEFMLKDVSAIINTTKQVK